MVPAPTSVLCGSQRAQPRSAQYCWSLRIASWKVGTVAEAPDPFAADAACALAGASVEMARATRTARRADAMRGTPTFDACIRIAEAPTFAGPHHDITAWGDVAMPRDPAALPRARRAPGAARP